MWQRFRRLLLNVYKNERCCVFCYAPGREADPKVVKEMLAECPDKINFTHFLTLFGEKLHGNCRINQIISLSFPCGALPTEGTLVLMPSCANRTHLARNLVYCSAVKVRHLNHVKVGTNFSRLVRKTSHFWHKTGVSFEFVCCHF